MKKQELAIYRDLLGDIKIRVRQAQVRAALSANAEMLYMYWDIGRLITARRDQESWGAGIIPRLATDLKNELPEQKGFSPSNIKRMMRFWESYPQLFSIGPPPVAQLDPQKKLAEIGPRPVVQLILSPRPRSSNFYRVIAEYALRDIGKPIGVADYELTRALPAELASSLPSIEEIEAELSANRQDDAR